MKSLSRRVGSRVKLTVADSPSMLNFDYAWQRSNHSREQRDEPIGSSTFRSRLDEVLIQRAEVAAVDGSCDGAQRVANLIFGQDSDLFLLRRLRKRRRAPTEQTHPLIAISLSASMPPTTRYEKLSAHPREVPSFRRDQR